MKDKIFNILGYTVWELKKLVPLRSEFHNSVIDGEVLSYENWQKHHPRYEGWKDGKGLLDLYDVKREN